ncbi:MAG: arginase [Sphingobacteriales bacterium]|nr:MAG: arginase [Sphingobacteriales bacterium]
MQAIHLFQKEDLDQYCSPREGEAKIGQTILVPEHTNWKDWLVNQKAQFVLLGIPEDIGVRANGGIGGAQTAWEPFLKAFLNIQDNTFLKGKHMILLGTVAVQELMERYTPDATPAALREGVASLDELLYPVIEAIVSARKIPILIGGGHNNAYPLIKGLSMAKNEAVNAINLDAHADFRAQEGRHSGNGFSYAYTEGYLKKYAALGLHQAYNNAAMIAQFDTNPDLKAIWFDSLYLQQELTFKQALQQALVHVKEIFFGVELDLDCIADTLSSAQSPLGFSRTEAWQYVFECAAQAKAAYLHLTEGVAFRTDGVQYPMTGKLLSYLVQAFVKGKQKM